MPADLTSVSIVLLGSFQPDAFTPEALAKAKAISDSDAAAAKFVALAPGSLTQYKLPWVEILVADDRVQLTTPEAPYVRVSDLAQKAILEVAPTATVKMIGINFEQHYDLGSVAARDSLGMRLAPPEAWGAWGKEIAASMDTKDGATHGGLALIRMRQYHEQDDVSGWLDIAVAPSAQIPGHRGVAFRTNHHFQSRVVAGEQLPADSRPVEPLVLLRTLAAVFDRSIETAERIFAGILGR